MKTISCEKTCEPMEVSEPTKSAELETRKSYPTLYLSDIGGLEDIPDGGEMKITFKRKSRSVRTESENGGDEEVHTSVELEIQSITFDDTQGDAPSDTEPSLEELFDQSTTSNSD